MQRKQEMSSQTILVAFMLLAIVVLSLTVSAEPNDLICGDKGPRDFMVHRESFKRASKWLQIVKAEYTFTTDTGRNISLVRLLDQNQKGNGATASITAGGPDFTFVTVHFQSKRGHSIDFIAELFAKN